MALIAEQWGRLLYWFNSNSDAIQAFSSLTTVFLTLYILKTVTAAERGWKIAQQQLHASSQPVIELSVERGVVGETVYFGRRSINVCVHVGVKNVGVAALKIKRLFVVVQRKEDHKFVAQYEPSLPDYTNRVLARNEGFSDDADLEVRSKEDQNATFGIHVGCTDLSELKIHSFYWHPTHGTRHSAEEAKA